MAAEQYRAETVPLTRGLDRSLAIVGFLNFLQDAREHLSKRLASKDNPQVREIRGSIEDHYIDDQGKPAMYLPFESALYDDAQAMVTLWGCFDRYPQNELLAFKRMLRLELDGLTGDRHPRKIFDRSPFGIAALVVGSITIWMTVLKTYTGEDLSELLELVRFSWIAGTMWIVGLFVVVWYILRTHRNNCQVAFLGSVARSLDLYIDED